MGERERESGRVAFCARAFSCPSHCAEGECHRNISKSGERAKARERPVDGQWIRDSLAPGAHATLLIISDRASMCYIVGGRDILYFVVMKFECDGNECGRNATTKRFGAFWGFTWVIPLVCFESEVLF